MRSLTFLILLKRGKRIEKDFVIFNSENKVRTVKGKTKSNY